MAGCRDCCKALAGRWPPSTKTSVTAWKDVVVLTHVGVRTDGSREREWRHGPRACQLHVRDGRRGQGAERVYGQWPGLAKEQLNEDRDLTLTTDFRDVFAEVLVGHLGCENPDVVFPGYSIDPTRFTGLV